VVIEWVEKGGSKGWSKTHFAAAARVLSAGAVGTTRASGDPSKARSLRHGSGCARAAECGRCESEHSAVLLRLAGSWLAVTLVRTPEAVLGDPRFFENSSGPINPRRFP
jgi:hypothetical protein